MSTGISGTYAINSTPFELTPSTFRWIKRSETGVDGNGHPVYPAVRDAEIKWGLISVNDLKQIIDAYEDVQNTGTVSWDLPGYGTSAYTFKTYSGTTMEEPEMGEYFAKYVTDVSLIIHNIRT